MARSSGAAAYPAGSVLIDRDVLVTALGQWREHADRAGTQGAVVRYDGVIVSGARMATSGG